MPEKPTPAAGSREGARWSGSIIVVALVGLAAAWPLVGDAPPRHITLGTGALDGGYHAFGEAYRDALAEHGVEVEVVTTAGSVDNLRRLAAGTLDVALVQGGTSAAAFAELDDEPPLVGVGSVYHEPLWIFHRSAWPVEHLTDLAGARVAVGGDGSGTAAVARALLHANGLPSAARDGDAQGGSVGELVEIGGAAATDALLAGDIDAAFFVGTSSSDAVRRLARRDGEDITLLSLSRAEAYGRRWHHLSPVVLPRGTLDLALVLPDRDVELVAPLATLVAHEDLHAAIMPLLLEAAEEVHGTGGYFDVDDAFPSPDHLEQPLSPAAERWFEHGTSFLYRVLPFPIAATIDRLKILLLPLLTLLLPLIKVAPPVYRWRIRSRIFRWYRVLRRIETEVKHAPTDDERATARAALADMEREISDVEVPDSYMEELYNLRMHLALVRRDVEESETATPPSAS